MGLFGSSHKSGPDRAKGSDTETEDNKNKRKGKKVNDHQNDDGSTGKSWFK